MVLEKTEIHANMGGKESKWVFQTSLLKMQPSKNGNQGSAAAGFEDGNAGLSHVLPREGRLVARSG